jgi:hypothetical protein
MEGNINQCVSCGLIHEDVECGGIYYCPNPACTVCGSEWFKHGLKSYRSKGYNTYTVDPEEMILAVMEIFMELEPCIRKAALRSLKKHWLSEDNEKK